jgi:predicted CXXCH cytochrome family protein
MGRKINRKVFLFAIAAVILGGAPTLRSASIVGSKHDISVTGGEVCVHCHTPHFASVTITAPLWNRTITNINVFTMYTSPTMDTATPSGPSGLSLACLGCHDSVSAPEAATSNDFHRVINVPGPGLTGIYSKNCEACHWAHGPMYSIPATGPNLTNDHPISIIYPTQAQDAGFIIPPNLQKGWSDVPLFSGKMECATCHNVHDPARTPFLRISNSGSALCYKCHIK